MNDQFEKIIIKGIQFKASDIHINLDEICKVSFRIQGVLKNTTTIPIIQALKLINLIKFSSNIDINYRLKPQTGHFHFYYKDKKYFLRVSSIPRKDKESVVIRILNNLNEITIDQLTNNQLIVNYLKKITLMNNGLFLVSGPTGSGKSTTLYTMLDYINENNSLNIVTLEDPIEIEKHYSIQVEINNELGINFQSTLKQILRHDPDVIMIGEIRDKETAKLAITAALTGHLVLATIHSSNCIATIHRLLDLGIQKIDLDEILVGVVNQKMIHFSKSKHILMEFIKKDEISNYLNCNFINYYDFKKSLFDCKNDVRVLI